MATLDHWITNYLNDCRYRKHLDVKTLRAYRSDLNEFTTYIVDQDVDFLDKHSISAYVNDLHKTNLLVPSNVKLPVCMLSIVILSMKNWWNRIRSTGWI